MKKITLLLAAITIVSSAYAKEIMPVAEVETEVPVVAVAQSDMYLNVRVGGDIEAQYEKFSDINLTDETDGFGGEVAFEGYKTLTDNFDLGLGLAYQFHADRDTETNGDYEGSGVEFDSIPLYLTAKYNFMINSEIKPYLKANLGYSFNFNSSDYEGKSNSSTSVDDGLYWALGGGLEYNNFTVDLMYAVNEAEVSNDYNGEKDDNDYERVVLSAGYRFNL